MNYTEIKSKRITLRKATADDAQMLCHWYADGRIMVHVGFPDGINESIDNLKNKLTIENLEHADNALFIISDEFNTPIGECNCKNLDSEKCNVGIKICELTAQGKGYGEEAFRAFISYLFTTYNLKHIDLDTLIENIRAQKLYKKLGFKIIKVNENCWVDPTGKSRTAIEMTLTRDDFYPNYTIKHHYDSLIDENNDPCRDPLPLREYMNKWDGQAFIDKLQLTTEKTVLEIGVGTGRLAMRVCNNCKSLTGIDLSPKTIIRAKENLQAFKNITLICADFMDYPFESKFDVIYSSLTFMHIKDKQVAINKVSQLLNAKGRFVLSIDKNQSTVLNINNRKIDLFPDTSEAIINYIRNANLFVEKQFETEFAIIFVAVKK